MNALTTEQVLAVPADALAMQSSASLFALKTAAAASQAAAKAITDHLDRALDLKYAELAHQLRLEAGKDTGVVHFDDDQVRVTADLPKKVTWDQQQLSEIAARIAAAGDNVADYIETDYAVAESRFNNWPPALKEQFAPARTLKPGKPTYRLALAQENQ